MGASSAFPDITERLYPPRHPEQALQFANGIRIMLSACSQTLPSKIND
jgi:hypothetical protein